MASKSVDWKKAKKDYITTNKGYREIAEEYGVSAAFINRRGKAENWGEQRKQYIEKTFTKTIEKISDKESDALAAHYKANDLLVQLLVDILEHPEMRELYLRSGRDLKDYMAALNSSEMLKRREKNILTVMEQERLDMEKQRLEIEKARTKAVVGDDEDDDTGVVLLAPTLERGDDDEEDT